MEGFSFFLCQSLASKMHPVKSIVNREASCSETNKRLKVAVLLINERPKFSSDSDSSEKLNLT